MANVDGTWDTVVSSPTGDRKATLIVNASSGTFTGTWGYSGEEAVEVQDGKVDEDHLTWKAAATNPLPTTLVCQAMVNGDTMTGTVNEGDFGTFALTATRT